MTDRFWWPRRKRPARGRPPHPAPGPGEPGNPPPGHTQWTSGNCACEPPCSIEYGPDGAETRRWSCERHRMYGGIRR